MRVWYERLDFYENPFSIKPIFYDDIFGYAKEMKKIVMLMKKGSIIQLKGDYGLGKTTILNHLIERFGGKRKLIYCSCNRFDNDLDVDSLVDKAGSLFSRIFKRKKRNLLLFLDEAHELSKDEMGEIYEYFMDNFFKSIILVNPNKSLDNLPKEMKERLINIKLDGLNEQDAVKLVKKRLEGYDIMSDQIIKKVYSLSGKNPRLFLSNLEDVCRRAVEEGDEKVKEKHLAEIE